jgi:(p)ppGpp synthase/HD superfamily hydrolase
MIHFSKKIQKAIQIASHIHQDHRRIGLDLPYITHPYSVALIVAEFYEDEDVFCAALLHDTVEDSIGYGFDDMRTDFGPHIATIVSYVTEEKTGADSRESLRANWQARKHAYLEKIRTAPKEAMLVSAGDTIHNLRSLMETYRLYGTSFWSSFSTSIDKKMHYYGELVSILSERLDNAITQELRLTYEKARALLIDGKR